MRLGCPKTPSLLTVLAVLAVVPTAQAAPKRIVALTPFTANTLVGIGVTPIGVGQTLGGQKRLAKKLDGVRALPLSHPNGPNMEQLARVGFAAPATAPDGLRAATVELARRAREQ